MAKSWRLPSSVAAGLKAIDSGYRTVLSYTSLAAFYATADKMPEAKAALAEALSLNPNLSVAWFHAHNSAFVDTGLGFREAKRNERDPKDLRAPLPLLACILYVRFPPN